MTDAKPVADRELFEKLADRWAVHFRREATGEYANPVTEAFWQLFQDYVAALSTQGQPVAATRDDEFIVGVKAMLAGPCPICNGIEGCDHSKMERLRAYDPAKYRAAQRVDVGAPLYAEPKRIDFPASQQPVAATGDDEILAFGEFVRRREIEDMTVFVSMKDELRLFRAAQRTAQAEGGKDA